MGALDGIKGTHSAFWELTGRRVLLVEAHPRYGEEPIGGKMNLLQG
eukprot:gene5562-43233_t